MSIDRIGQYGGFYSNYKMPEIRTVSAEEVRKQNEQASRDELVQSRREVKSEYTSPAKEPASRMADLEDISLTFNANETFDYIGKDASLADLDMMSAISDMQKDKVLEQYQYFVGPKDFAGSVVTSTPDGTVVQK